jgi:dihydrofolate reductase
VGPIEAWALADPEAWLRVFGKVPKLPPDPEALWGDPRDAASNHPKCVLRRCLDEIGRSPTGNAVALLLAQASLDQLAARCPRGFGRFVADLRRVFPRIECLVAAATDRAIGLEREPPWGFDTLRDHVSHLHALVTAVNDERCAVIFGRKTWQTLPALPLSPGRLDIVVTRDAQLEVPGHLLRASSFDAAVYDASSAGVERIYVLGGGELYGNALSHFRCMQLHYTRVDGEFPAADTWFPAFEADTAWRLEPTSTQHHDNGFDYRMERWVRFAT